MAREGLERLDGVASVAEDPDLTNRTARVFLKRGRWFAPSQIAEHVKGLHIGATVRGIEATIAGTVTRKREELLIRFGARTLALAPLTAKIQQDPATGALRPITETEKNAYQRLRECLPDGRKARYEVTGVLVSGADARVLLQVRQALPRQ